MDNIEKRVNGPTGIPKKVLREFNESMELIKKYISPRGIVPEPDPKWKWYDSSSIRIPYQ